MKGRAKYGNKKVELDGHRFDSKREAAHYCTLKAMLAAGQIRDLVLQPQYDFTINGKKVCGYIADFEFERERPDGKWEIVTQDVKGMILPIFNLKAKLFLALVGRPIEIVK